MTFMFALAYFLTSNIMISLWTIFLWPLKYIVTFPHLRSDLLIFFHILDTEKMRSEVLALFFQIKCGENTEIRK